MVVDMADRMSTGRREFFFESHFEMNGHPKRPGGEAVAAGDLYLPGGW